MNELEFQISVRGGSQVDAAMQSNAARVHEMAESVVKDSQRTEQALNRATTARVPAAQAAPSPAYRFVLVEEEAGKAGERAGRRFGEAFGVRAQNRVANSQNDLVNALQWNSNRVRTMADGFVNDARRIERALAEATGVSSLADRRGPALGAGTSTVRYVAPAPPAIPRKDPVEMRAQERQVVQATGLFSLGDRRGTALGAGTSTVRYAAIEDEAGRSGERAGRKFGEAFGFRAQNRVTNSLVAVAGLDSPIGRVANTVEYLGHMADRSGLSIGQMLGKLAPSLAVAAGVGVITSQVVKLSDETDKLYESLGRPAPGGLENWLAGFKELATGNQSSGYLDFLTGGASIAVRKSAKAVGLDRGERSPAPSAEEFEALRGANFSERAKKVAADLVHQETAQEKLELWFNSAEVKARHVTADSLKDEAKAKLAEIEKDMERERVTIQIDAAVRLGGLGGPRDFAAEAVARLRRGESSRGAFEAGGETPSEQASAFAVKRAGVLKLDEQGWEAWKFQFNKALADLVPKEGARSPIDLFNEWLNGELEKGRLPEELKGEATDKYRELTFQDQSQKFFERGDRLDRESRDQELADKTRIAEGNLSRMRDRGRDGSPLAEMSDRFSVESYRNVASTVQTARDQRDPGITRQVQLLEQILTELKRQDHGSAPTNPLEVY